MIAFHSAFFDTFVNIQPLDSIPLWSLVLIVAAILIAALEGGYRVGQWRHRRAPGEKEQPVGAIVGSILGLLALVLGFTFSMAAMRFDSRRQAVLNEANAIGTTYLRTRVLPEPQGSASAALLREYVELRIVPESWNPRNDRMSETIARSVELQMLLWDQAELAAAEAPNQITALYIESLNSVIDLHADRIHVAIRSRIPFVIWCSLFVITLIGMSAVGYQAGLSQTRRSPATLALVVTFAVVLMLILDLDRSQEGLLNVSQQALIDVQEMMSEPSPQDPAN